jgi:hypothetical protein
LNQGLLIPQFDSPVQLANGTFVRGGDTRYTTDFPSPPTPFISHPNNLKDFTKQDLQLHNISISNGFDKGDYRLSFTDLLL